MWPQDPNSCSGGYHDIILTRHCDFHIKLTHSATQCCLQACVVANVALWDTSRLRFGGHKLSIWNINDICEVFKTVQTWWQGFLMKQTIMRISYRYLGQKSVFTNKRLDWISDLVSYHIQTTLKQICRCWWDCTNMLA